VLARTADDDCAVVHNEGVAIPRERASGRGQKDNVVSIRMSG
jgi:hypothetical protein